MSSSLVTQSLSEKPLVVLIAANSILAYQIRDFFTSSELAVVHIKPEEFWKNDFIKQPSLSFKNSTLSY